MAQMKWKYAKPQKKRYDQYIRLQPDTPKKMTITGWNFKKNEYTEAIFFADVVEEDGEEVSKVWSVWSKDLRDMLKTKLKKKDPLKDKVKIEVNLHVKNAIDSFELKVLKK